jgi:hypothetical protein
MPQAEKVVGKADEVALLRHSGGAAVRGRTSTLCQLDLPPGTASPFNSAWPTEIGFGLPRSNSANPHNSRINASA